MVVTGRLEFKGSSSVGSLSRLNCCNTSSGAFECIKMLLLEIEELWLCDVNWWITFFSGRNLPIIGIHLQLQQYLEQQQHMPTAMTIIIEPEMTKFHKV